jgi:hypothetical protein
MIKYVFLLIFTVCLLFFRCECPGSGMDKADYSHHAGAGAAHEVLHAAA